MLAVAVRVEYCVGHSRLGLAVSVTVHAVSGRAPPERCGLAGIAAPIPAPGEDGGRVGTGFALRAAVGGADAGLAAAETVTAMIMPGTASTVRASLARQR